MGNLDVKWLILSSLQNPITISYDTIIKMTVHSGVSGGGRGGGPWAAKFHVHSI